MKNFHDRVNLAIELVGQRALIVGQGGESIKTPGELVQLVVKEEGLGGFSPVVRGWLKEVAKEKIEIGLRTKNC